MTIDERLEALTQSVELLASMHRETERQQQETQRLQQETQRFVAQRFSELAESIRRLDKLACNAAGDASQRS
jgi:hypothetical protein